MNHWPECIDVWHGSSLGQGDSSVQIKTLGSYMAPPQGLKLLRSNI